MPKRAIEKVFLLLARATDAELVYQIEYLKAENRVLRCRLPKKIRLEPAERELLMLCGSRVGPAIRDLITVVTPGSFFRWLRKARHGSRPAPGRPTKAEEARALVMKIAREAGLGYTRILGELKKLGIRISRTTIRNILKEEGLAPERSPTSLGWDAFLRRHFQTLWACDFFSKKVLTSSGFVEYFVLFFIHVRTRRVHIVGISPNPDGAWMLQQARNLTMLFSDLPENERPSFILRDRDGKFTKEFDALLLQTGVRMLKIPPRSPNLNAYAEAWVGTVKKECLNHFVAFGEGHLRYLIREYVDYYNTVRPHQGLGCVPIGGLPVSPVSGPVRCQHRLGGLIKHYYRQAA